MGVWGGQFLRLHDRAASMTLKLHNLVALLQGHIDIECFHAEPITSADGGQPALFVVVYQQSRRC